MGLVLLSFFILLASQASIGFRSSNDNQDDTLQGPPTLLGEPLNKLSPENPEEPLHHPVRRMVKPYTTRPQKTTTPTTPLHRGQPPLQTPTTRKPTVRSTQPPHRGGRPPLQTPTTRKPTVRSTQLPHRGGQPPLQAPSTRKPTVRSTKPPHRGGRPPLPTPATRKPTTKPSSGCTLDFGTDFSNLHPPLFATDIATPTLLYPKIGSNLINVGRNQKILIVCPDLTDLVIPTTGKLQVTKAECKSGKDFIIHSQELNIRNVLCGHPVEHSTQRTADYCHGNDKYVDIGFPFSPGKFLTTVRVCWDNRAMMARWSKSIMLPIVKMVQKCARTRPFFKAGDFYGNIDVNDAYKVESQRRSFAALLGSSQIAKRYINEKKHMVLTRGHLVAKSDHIYGGCQLSTFWFLNVAPQWETFNSGNWNKLEESVRQFAMTRRSELAVYTGIHGRLRFSGTNNLEKDIFLYTGGRNALPVPKFFWKIVYDPATKQGIAFFGLNNPYATQNDLRNINICSDIFDTITWAANGQRKNVVQGYMFACTVAGLQTVVVDAPLLQVNSLLV